MNFRMLKYLIALNDLHNFKMPIEKYRSLLREEYLSFRISDETLNVQNFNSLVLTPMTEGYVKYFNRKMLDEFYFLARELMKKHSMTIFIDGWKFKGFVNSDFRDTAHLNRNGALKFSALLNDVILQIDRIPLQQKISLIY